MHKIEIESLNLSLRQKKIVHILQNRASFMTGTELAKQLNVSARTIRSDILAINQALAGFHAQIQSERSKGYLFYAPCTSSLQQAVKQTAVSFATREERVHYLAFQLCIADDPISLYDLEEELYISRATLEKDLHLLKIKYVLDAPHISLTLKKDSLSFEQSESKRRQVLHKLLHEDWDYHAKGNTYYGYDFLNAAVLELIMKETALHLKRHEIRMEDTILASLNITVAIIYQRLQSGHLLPSMPPVPRPDLKASCAANELMDTLEQKLACTFSIEDRDEVYKNIASGHLLDSSIINFHTASHFFPPVTIQMANDYLSLIKKHFLLDFSNDEDFYITLLQQLQYMQNPVCLFNMQENTDIAMEKLWIEFEIAYLFQDIAIQHLGYYIGQPELLYLSHCISGALEYFFHNHPEFKITTAICSQLNLSAVWAIKRKILGAFGNYLRIDALLPVNARSAYDFSHTNLILTTVNKPITDNASTDTIQISPFIESGDLRKLECYIKQKQFQALCPGKNMDILSLISEAFWQENQKAADPFTIIESMAQNFIQDGITDHCYTEHILRRESISSFASHSGIVFLHSHKCYAQTKLSFMTFQHCVNWRKYKIWIAVMASFRQEDKRLLFELRHLFQLLSRQSDKIKFYKTKKDLLHYLSEFV